MSWDDDVPKPKKQIFVGENLDALSVAELEERIASHRAEIERLAAEIAKKKNHEAAASKLFKS
jgi:uncharacterized small protein (DUF1192 family)